jgi:putative copper export protein
MTMLEEALTFPDVVREYVSFIGLLAAGGAMGFRWSAARPLLRLAGNASSDVPGRIANRALRTAAVIGIVGVLISIGFTLVGAMGAAAEKHATLAAVLMGNKASGAISLGLTVLALLGYLLAAGRLGIGWALATVGVVGKALSGLLSGNVLRVVNPFHVLMASLWIGTLGVLVIAGLTAAMRADVPRDERGPAVASMVNAFSPLALVASGLLALSGLVTAWRHLHKLSNLWSTPYGWALIVKLCLVLVVVALGAWNWRRVSPGLGTEEGAFRLRRSATSELAVAALVLAATAVLVSLPAPRGPGGPGGPGEGPPPAGAPAGQPGGAPPATAH